MEQTCLYTCCNCDNYILILKLQLCVEHWKGIGAANDTILKVNQIHMFSHKYVFYRVAEIFEN